MAFTSYALEHAAVPKSRKAAMDWTERGANPVIHSCPMPLLISHAPHHAAVSSACRIGQGMLGLPHSQLGRGGGGGGISTPLDMPPDSLCLQRPTPATCAACLSRESRG